MEVVSSKQRAKFFKDEYGRHVVEISAVGDPCTLIAKVTPEHIDKWPREWAAYESGQIEVEAVGIPLTEIPGCERDAIQRLKLAGVRTVEELAALDEAAAVSLGLGGLTFWKSAKLLLQAREAEALKALMAESEARRGPGRPRKIETEVAAP